MKPDPYRIFGFWTGDNDLPAKRRAGLATFPETGLEPVLVTADTLGDWIRPEHPLHAAYPLLTPIHRADYLRGYFMYHYGGGYSDVKRQGGSWLPAVERVLASRRLLGAGYREIRGASAGLERDAGGNIHLLRWQVSPALARLAIDVMRAARPLLIGNGAFYFKPQTGFARAWLAEAERRLDRLLPALRANPPKGIRDRLGGLPGVPSTYPLPWQHILGEIVHPLALFYAPRLLRALPVPDFEDYLGEPEEEGLTPSPARTD